MTRLLDLTPDMQLWRIGENQSLIATPKPSKAKPATNLIGNGRKYLQAGSNPVQNLIIERVAEDQVS